MRIAPAVLDDIPALTRLLAVLFAQEREFGVDSKKQATGLALIIGRPDTGVVLVARDQGQIVGMVNLLYTVSTALGARVALLEDMVVAPDVRGAGIGSALIEAAIAQARRAGCKRITLLSDGDNTAAHRFYERNGFVASDMRAFRLLLD